MESHDACFANERQTTRSSIWSLAVVCQKKTGKEDLDSPKPYAKDYLAVDAIDKFTWPQSYTQVTDLDIARIVLAGIEPDAKGRLRPAVTDIPKKYALGDHQAQLIFVYLHELSYKGQGPAAPCRLDRLTRVQGDRS